MNTLFFLFLLIGSVFGQGSATITIDYGSDPEFGRTCENAANVLIEALNKTAETGSLEIDKSIFDSNGDYIAYRDFKALVEATRMETSDRSYVRTMYGIGSNLFEIREITVRTINPEKSVEGRDKVGEYDPNRDLNITFNAQGLVNSVSFAIDKTKYYDILSSGLNLEDIMQRKLILNYVEQFRTAYNQKDISFIEKQFSDQALIIVGKRVEEGEQKASNSTLESLGSEKYQYIKKSKDIYISDLKRIFSVNSFIDIKYEDIKVYQHPKFQEVYGVNLVQKYNSEHYSDTGYLFLMIDFYKPEQPTIWVRAWQEMGSVVAEGERVIDMSMFDLIR